MIYHLGIFAAAAVCEIGGCFAVWSWMKRGASGWVAALGVVSLIVFAGLLSRIEFSFAGRAYAAYGGIYIAAALAWLWLVEKQRPSAADVTGAAICVLGALVILGFALRVK